MTYQRKLEFVFLTWMTFTALNRANEMESTCDEFDQLAEQINSHPDRYSCSSLAGCNGIKCAVDLFDLAFVFAEVYSVSVWILPCTSPPSLRVSITHPADSGVEPFVRVLSESTYVDDFGESSLNLTIDNNEDDGFMRVQIKFDNSVIFDENSDGTLLPWTMFNVSRTKCDITACQAILQAIDTAAESNFTFGDSLVCRRTPRCDGLTCQVSPFDNIDLPLTVSAKIVSCYDPPAIQIAIENPVGGADLLNELFTTSVSVPLASEFGIDGITLIVTVDQFHEGLGVEVMVSVVQLTDQQTPLLETILEYQYFPVDREDDYCDGFNPTCLALEGVVDKADRNNIACNTTEQCDGVLCWFDLLQTGILFPANAFLVPCNKPMPAVDVKILDPTNSSQVIFNRRVSDSEKISFFNFEIDILVEHLPEDFLGFQITVLDTESEQAEPIQAISYSIIPVNTTSCTSDSGHGGAGHLQPLSAISVVMATVAVAVSLLFF